MKRNWVFTNLSHKVLYINRPFKSLVPLQIQDASPSVRSSCHKHFIPRGNPTINPRMEPLLSSSMETAIEEDPSKDDPQAELCSSEKTCVSPQDLGSPLALSEWLASRLAHGSEILSQWGKAQGTKRVSNLWKELLEGEISLEDSTPPKRTVHVACVKITDKNGNMLLESHQEMTDGSIRHRNRPLSEKMKPGESVYSACLRGIREELGSTLGAAECVDMRSHTYQREEEERESFTYPGLMTRYVLHHMEAVMEHLPCNDFVTEENEYSAADNNVGDMSRSLDDENALVGVRRHFWKWIPSS